MTKTPTLLLVDKLLPELDAYLRLPSNFMTDSDTGTPLVQITPLDSSAF